MKYKWKRTSDGDLLTYFKDEYGKEKYMIFGEPGKKDGWYITHSDPEKPMYGGKRGLESWFDIRNGQINRDIKDKQQANELKQKIKKIYNEFLSASRELENMRSAFNKKIVANELNKIAKMLVSSEISQVKSLKFDNLSYDGEKYGSYAWKDNKGNYEHEVVAMIGEEKGKVIVVVFDAASVKFKQSKPLSFDSVEDLMKNKSKVIAYVEKLYKKIWSK